VIVVCCPCLEKFGPWGLSSVVTIGARRTHGYRCLLSPSQEVEPVESLSVATVGRSRYLCLFLMSGEAKLLGVVVWCRCLEKLDPWGLSSVAVVGARRTCGYHCLIPPLRDTVIVLCFCRRWTPGPWGLSSVSAFGERRTHGHHSLMPLPREAVIVVCCHRRGKPRSWGSLSVSVVWRSWAHGDSCLLSLLGKVGLMGILGCCCRWGKLSLQDHYLLPP